MNLESLSHGLELPLRMVPWWFLGGLLFTFSVTWWWSYRHRASKEAFSATKKILVGLCWLVFGGGSLSFMLGFVWVPTRGHSMAPTFPSERWLAVNAHAYQWPWSDQFHTAIEVGDVIMFQDPQTPEERFFIKRVIAKAGDEVEHVNNQILVNGRPLMKTVPLQGPMMDWYRRAAIPITRHLGLGEVQLHNRPTFQVLTSLDQRLHRTWIVPEGHVFVVGDNWANSLDSRNFGPLPVNLVYGRVRGKWDWEKGWISP